MYLFICYRILFGQDMLSFFYDPKARIAVNVIPLLIQKPHHLLFHSVPWNSAGPRNKGSKLHTLEPNSEGQGDAQEARLLDDLGSGVALHTALSGGSF
jgi:hypothetical protein